MRLTRIRRSSLRAKLQHRRSISRGAAPPYPERATHHKKGSGFNAVTRDHDPFRDRDVLAGLYGSVRRRHRLALDLTPELLLRQR